MSMKKEIVKLLKNLTIEGNLLSLKFSIPMGKEERSTTKAERS